MPHSVNSQVPPPDSYRGRLQRAPTNNGYRVATFADVLKRHGFTMAGLAAVCIAVPGAWSMVENTTSRGAAHPVPYLSGLAGLILFFAYWSSRHSYPAKRQVQWILYLLMISVAEELTALGRSI